MTQGASVSFNGCTWKFSADSCREYSAALAASEAEVTERFGQRPHFGSPDAVAAWEHEVVSAAPRQAVRRQPASVQRCPDAARHQRVMGHCGGVSPRGPLPGRS